MAWIFQGNPKRFAIDEYLSSFSTLIYWYTPTNASEIRLGDRVFVWRSGAQAGAIAIGTVVETPVQASKVKHPEALGYDLWSAGAADPNELETGIRPDDVRLTIEEGMLSRRSVAAEPALARSTIIRRPTGTVFRLAPEEAATLERMWGFGRESSPSWIAGVTEGEPRLRAHYKRERSVKLRADKLRAFLKDHGRYFCELCGEEVGARYPRIVNTRMYEIHHRKPLALANKPVRTTLEDLALLCANCHRSVHVTEEVDRNYATLLKHFGR